MIAGDTVVCIPLEGDPQNVVVIPVLDGMAPSDKVVMFPISEIGEYNICISNRDTTAGDMGLVIPINGNKNNIMFINCREYPLIPITSLDPLYSTYVSLVTTDATYGGCPGVRVSFGNMGDYTYGYTLFDISEIELSKVVSATLFAAGYDAGITGHGQVIDEMTIFAYRLTETFADGDACGGEGAGPTGADPLNYTETNYTQLQWHGIGSGYYFDVTSMLQDQSGRYFGVAFVPDMVQGNGFITFTKEEGTEEPLRMRLLLTY